MAAAICCVGPCNAIAASCDAGGTASASVVSVRAEARIWATAGETLVVPFTPSDQQRRAGSIPARLSRGDTLFAPLWWIGRTEAAAGATRPAAEQTPGAALLAARGAAWMGERGRWAAVAATDTSRRAMISPDGAWYLVIEIPPDAGGLGIEIDGRPAPTGWIPRSIATARPAATAGNAGNGWLGAAIDSARRDPRERWRARLASGEPLAAVGPAPDEFADRAVEALADQIGARWAQALHNVSEADAAVAARLRQRLAAIADFGPARAPAWPTDTWALDHLLGALLETSSAGAAGGAAQVARAWIDAQPRAACWIADDAVMFDPSAGRIVSRVAAVTLDGAVEPDLLMVRTTASPTPLDVVTLRPFVSGSGLFSLEPEGQNPAVVHAGIGRWVARRAVQRRPIDAAPPGAPIGPLLVEWTLDSWQSACTEAGDPRGATAPAGMGRPPAAPGRGTMGMLLAEAPVATGAPGASDLRWVLYVECGLTGTDPRDATTREELVVAVSGAGGEAMLRAFADGQVVHSSGESSRARVARDDRVWRIWIPIPPGVVGGGGWLKLGVLRTEIGGGRSSWPRPVFPWEDRPSQAVFDLRAWNGLER